MIMLMFAQIYGTAIGTITEQRGMGANDQKSRILSTILQNDLANITYRQTTREYGTAAGIVPLSPGDEAILDRDNQQGYFYLSENDPGNPTDDVLQFTAKVQDSDFDNWFVGKAEFLDIASGNEPNKDGGPSNAPGQSRFAEISYFLRQGTLYRRVLLLRDAGGQDEQPGTSTSDRYFGAGRQSYPTTASSTSFWRDFDYSATRVYLDATNSYPWFNGKSSLVNLPEAIDRKPIALPWNRFGHLNSSETGNPNRGQPREYTNETPGSGEFIGRFIHEETAHPFVTYPGTADNGIFDRAIPLTLNATTKTINDNDGNAVSATERLGEDVLMTNVESFDVEVWEPEFGGFVQLGHSGTGEFSSSSRSNPGYGPRQSGYNNIFDTWHPDVKSGNPANFVPPPYRPVVSGTTLTQWSGDDGTTMTYQVGNRVLIPALQTEGEYNDSLYYEVIAVNGSPTTDVDGNRGTNRPEWIAVPGAVVQDNELTWLCVDNRVGLQAIRITIRYIDVQSRLPRQVTVVHSFMKSRPK